MVRRKGSSPLFPSRCPTSPPPDEVRKRVDTPKAPSDPARPRTSSARVQEVDGGRVDIRVDFRCERIERRKVAAAEREPSAGGRQPADDARAEVPSRPCDRDDAAGQGRRLRKLRRQRLHWVTLAGQALVSDSVG